MSAYLEEQIRGLADICEALICHIHWAGDGVPHEGHNAYPASGCHHETCSRYAEGHRKMTFGYLLPELSRLRGENDKLHMENEHILRNIIKTPQDCIDYQAHGKIGDEDNICNFCGEKIT